MKMALISLLVFFVVISGCKKNESQRKVLRAHKTIEFLEHNQAMQQFTAAQLKELSPMAVAQIIKCEGCEFLYYVSTGTKKDSWVPLVPGVE